MSSPAESLARSAPVDSGYSGLDRFLRERLLARLDDLRGGTLRIKDALGERLLGHADGNEPRSEERRVGKECRL